MFSLDKRVEIELRQNQQIKIFKHFNLADHDFSIDLSVSVPRGIVLSGDFVSGPRPFNWSISIEPPGVVGLKLGDRKSWVYGIALGLIEDQSHFRLKIEKKETIIKTELAGSTTETKISAGFSIPGNGIYVTNCSKQAAKRPLVITFGKLEISDYFNGKTPAHKDIDIITVFFGSDYAQMVSSIMFPSLKYCNLDRSFFKAKKITQHIYCREVDIPHLEGHLKVMSKYGYEVYLHTEYLNFNASKKTLKENLYLCYLDFFSRAIATDRLCLIAPPDHIFGYGLESVIKRMAPYDYVVAGHVRVAEETAVPAMIAASTSAKPVFSNNEEHVEFAVNEHPHPLVRHGLSHYEPYWWAVRSAVGYDVYFKEPPPLCIDPGADLINVALSDVTFGPYEAIDHDLVDYTFCHGRLKFVSDSQEFFWSEITSSKVYNPTIRNFYWNESSYFFARTPNILRATEQSLTQSRLTQRVREKVNLALTAIIGSIFLAIFANPRIRSALRHLYLVFFGDPSDPE